MKDAKAIEAERQSEGGTTANNDHPLAETVAVVPKEPPPRYDSIQTGAIPIGQDIPSVTPTIIAVRQEFGHGPVQCTCPRCQQTIVTRLEKSNGLMAWILCLVLVLIGCWLGCCLIPFCIKDIKTTIHYCPQCGAEVGRKEII